MAWRREDAAGWTDRAWGRPPSWGSSRNPGEVERNGTHLRRGVKVVARVWPTANGVSRYTIISVMAMMALGGLKGDAPVLAEQPSGPGVEVTDCAGEGWGGVVGRLGSAGSAVPLFSRRRWGAGGHSARCSQGRVRRSGGGDRWYFRPRRSLGAARSVHIRGCRRESEGAIRRGAFRPRGLKEEGRGEPGPPSELPSPGREPWRGTWMLVESPPSRRASAPYGL